MLLQAHPLACALQPQAQSRADAWLRNQLSLCDDLAWAESFAKACPVPGAQAKDYLPRTLAHKQHTALVGIRMMGGDRRKPFVEILAYEGPLAPWLPLALDSYERFGVTRCRVRQVERPTSTWLVKADQHLLVGVVEDSEDEVLTLQPLALVDMPSALALIETGYKAWTKRQPWMSGRVFPITRTELEPAIERGMAFEMHVDKQTVGLLVLEQAEEREWSGVLVLEQLVLPTFAGQGLAAKAQRAARPFLRGRPLMGTIDADNHASVRSALNAGRQRVDSWWWLGPDWAELTR